MPSLGSCQTSPCNWRDKNLVLSNKDVVAFLGIKLVSRFEGLPFACQCNWRLLDIVGFMVHAAVSSFSGALQEV